MPADPVVPGGILGARSIDPDGTDRKALVALPEAPARPSQEPLSGNAGKAPGGAGDSSVRGTLVADGVRESVLGLPGEPDREWAEAITAHWHRRYGRDPLAAWKPVRYRLPSGVETVAYSVSQCRRMKALGAVKVDAE